MAYKTDYERQRDDAIRRKMVAGNRHGWQDMGPLEDLMWNAEERIAEAKEPLEKLCQDLQGQVNNLKLELSQTATTKTNLEQRWTKLAGEKYSLQDQLQSVQKALEASSVEGTRLQDEVQTITASRYHFETVSKTLAEEKKKLEDSLRSTKGELAASRRKVEEHDEAKETFQKDLNVLTEAKTRAEKEIEKMTHIVKYLKEEAKTKDEDYRELESKCKVLEDGRENAQLTEKLEDAKLKLQKAQSDLENEQRNYELEKDTTKHLRTENAQLNHSLSSQEREVQAVKDKGRHSREVMQQVVKLLQTQVAAVRSDLDQERSRQSDLKDSVEQLLTRSPNIVRLLKTELVSRAAELQKCRDELRTTTAERDRLNQSETSAASQVSMQQQLHQFQEHVTQSLGQVHDRVAKVAADMSAVPELNRGVQQLQRQMSSSSSLSRQSSISGQQLTSRSPKLESATDFEEALDSKLMASSDVPITGQQRMLSSPRLQPTPVRAACDPGLDRMRTNSPDVSRMDHQSSIRDHHQQSFMPIRDHPPRSEEDMDPLLINGPKPSLPTRIAGQRTPFSNVASYSAFPFQTNLMSLGGFHLVPVHVPMSFPTTSVMPIHDDPSPMSLPSSSGSSFPMHGGRDSSLSATVATSLQDSVDPAVLREELKLPHLMPYVRSLSPVGCMIAGHLNMQTEWEILELATNDPVVRLQKLLSQWLDGREDEERPHNWGYFITLMKAVNQYQVVKRICTDLTARQAKS